jgi:hypothetical protein
VGVVAERADQEAGDANPGDLGLLESHKLQRSLSLPGGPELDLALLRRLLAGEERCDENKDSDGSVEDMRI